MSKHLVPVLAFIVIFVVSYQLLTPHRTAAPSSQPTGPDLLAAFAESDNHEQAAFDAACFAYLCAELAGIMEEDGKDKPRLTKGVQLDDLRIFSRRAQQSGRRYADTYPTLPAKVEEYLAEKLGTNGGPVDDAERAKWIQAYRGLASSAQYAAENL